MTKKNRQNQKKRNNHAVCMCEHNDTNSRLTLCAKLCVYVWMFQFVWAQRLSCTSVYATCIYLYLRKSKYLRRHIRMPTHSGVREHLFCITMPDVLMIVVMATSSGEKALDRKRARREWERQREGSERANERERRERKSEKERLMWTSSGWRYIFHEIPGTKERCSGI